MIETLLLGRYIVDKIAQTSAPRQLSNCHGYELRPTRGGPERSSAVVLICQNLKLMSRNQF
jgi:hypothetical protein